MPLLGGIFGKKSKSSARSINGNGVGTSDIDSAVSSPTNSYVTADKSLPSSPNGKSSLYHDAIRVSPSQVYPSIANGNASASSSKLRLPFSRKKSKVPVPDPTQSLASSPSTNFMAPPRPSYTQRLSTSAASDSDSSDVRRLRPPPSKSAIFAAYADPNSALSTRSLPSETTPSWPSIHTSSGPPVPAKEKRPSLFSWTKSTKPLPDSKSSTYLNPPPQSESDSSFNLKSFRHVRPPSPNASSSSLVVPPARPRGASVNSDSSQRISVAAFREAQARRSTAGSPVPSFRSPSPSLPPPAFPQDGQRGRASPRPSPQMANNHQRRRSANIAVGYTSESDESTTSSDEDSDDEVDHGRGVHRDGTITPRTRPLIGKRQAKSEIGHGSSYESSTKRQPPGFLTTRSQNGHGQPDHDVRQSSYVGNTQNSPIEPPPRSQSSLGIYGSRQRASNSTSALSPSGAAKRASILANANASLNQDPLAALKQTNRHVRDSSTFSNPSQPSKPANKPVDTDTSESESEDDAPLASLVPPRRPGSAMSSTSNTSLRTNGTRGPPGRAMSKPLIDINELTSKKPSVGPRKNNDDAFTKGGLLAGQMTNQQQTVLVESPTSIGFPSSPLSAGLTSKSPPGSTHFANPMSPPKEVQAYFSLDNRLANAQQPAPKAEKETSPERRRDGLTDRLTRLARGRGDTGAGGSNLKEKKSLSPPPPPVSQRTTTIQPESPRRSFVGMRPTSIANSKPSPPDEELIQDVDDSILRLIAKMGDSEESEKSSESESDAYGEPDQKETAQNTTTTRSEASRQPSPDKEKDRIAPIPIKQRAPPPAFSVMSRPPMQKSQGDDGHSSLTATMTTGTSASAKFSASSTRSSTVAESAPTSPPIPNSISAKRQRSSTLIPSSTSSSSTFGTSTSSFAKLNSRGGSSVASSGGYAASNASSTNITSPTSTGSPRLNSANADRANALRTVASAGSGLGRDSGISARSTTSPPTSPISTARQRSSTMVPIMPSQSQNKLANSTPVPTMPIKPFAVRRDSPASSTGDSSSGRAPLTPRDGSEIGVSSPRTATTGSKEKKEEWGSGVSGLGTASTRGSVGGAGAGAGRHVKRRSVSFDDEIRDDSVASTGGGRKTKEVDSDDPEARRRERRRSEAKAAIELGNVINGPGPVVSDDEDDLPINQAMNARISTVNPMMAMSNPVQMQMQFAGASGSPAAWGGNMSAWPQQRGAQMLSPAQFMVPPPADPSFFVAHQQAMMYAKQAYQMAVAQQAMAAAADEWDRNSVMGGSVYGGASNASVIVSPPQFGMMGLGNMGNGWSTGSVMFPNSSQSVYGGRGGISSSRSEYGGASGAMGGGNWSSARSSYGESFGPSDRLRPGMSPGGGNRNSGMIRDSGHYPPVPPIPQGHSGSSALNAAKGRGRTTSGPSATNRGAARKAPPPSSWKAGI